MVHLRVAGKRGLAALLSLWLIGLSVACISICLMHNEDSSEAAGLSESYEVTDAQDEECCPLTQTLVSNLPERLSFVLQISAHNLPSVITAIQINQELGNHRNNSFWSSSLDPPFERSCVLRI